MKITYYAENSSMGDTTPEDCDAYRDWAEAELKKYFPEHEIEVSEKPSFAQCETDDYDHEETITDCCHRLWENCPWDWV